MSPARARALALSFIAVCTSSSAARAAVTADGTWRASAGAGQMTMTLRERAGGRIIGYFPGNLMFQVGPSKRTGSSVQLQLLFSDPGRSATSSFGGVLFGNTLAGRSSETGSITFSRLSAVIDVENWMMRGGLTGNVPQWLRAGRLLDASGAFQGASFVALSGDKPLFLAYAGAITSWQTSGASQTLTVPIDDPSCPSQTTLSGTWDASQQMLSGPYQTADCRGSSAGSFFGVRESGTSTGDISDVLALLARFADALEQGSSSAMDAFSSSYLFDGKTKADWTAEVNRIFAAYSGLKAEIQGISLIATQPPPGTAAMFVLPRISWHLVVTGVPRSGGARATVWDWNVSDAHDGAEALHWIGKEGSSWRFVGNGQPAPFAVGLPIQDGDQAATSYGIWPFRVHAGGHPEGHPGWDFEYQPGAMVRAAAAGTIAGIETETDSDGIPGTTYYVRITHRPGYSTVYDGLHSLDPAVAVGASLGAGQLLGEPRTVQNGVLMVHFGIESGVVPDCPLDHLSASGRQLFDAIWPAVRYNEELLEPFPCNPFHVSYPMVATWVHQSGPDLGPQIQFIRTAVDSPYGYRLLDSSGALIEAGTISSASWDAHQGLMSLQPDGGGSAHNARYDIVNDTMWLTGHDAPNPPPPDLSGAAVYTLKQ